MAQRFQGLCLMQEEGWMHMDAYDDLPPDIRQRLRDSPFNLCAACVNCGHRDDMEDQICHMERLLRIRDKR